MEPIAFLGLLATTRLPSHHVRALGPTTPDQCRTRLLTTTTVDAATAVVARSVDLDGGDLEAVVEAWCVRTPDAMLRQASHHVGAEVRARAEVETDVTMPRPVALGVVAARSGVEAEDLARMLAYDDVQAALAHEDEADARVWTVSLLPEIRDLARQVAGLDHPARIPATGAPLVAATG